MRTTRYPFTHLFTLLGTLFTHSYTHAAALLGQTLYPPGHFLFFSENDHSQQNGNTDVTRFTPYHSWFGR